MWRKSIPIGALVSVLAAASASLLGTAGLAAAAERIAPAVVCTSVTFPRLAARLSADISAALRGRASTVALRLDSPVKGLKCARSGVRKFDSASVVKVTILDGLLRKALDEHRYLTATEATLARAMITRSDNAAASALWAELGHRYMQHFLDLAAMTQTILGPGKYWGLTQITARDEARLLTLLMTPNNVLDVPSRDYALLLMASVVPSQRWGVAAGTPDRVVAHIKNGWLPRATHHWRVHSIGCFTGRGWYSIVVLTQDNPTMSYGITTIERIARVIHHDLYPRAASYVPMSSPSPLWGVPDETLPALPDIP